MRAQLMHRERDFDMEDPLPPNADALIQDLDLTTLFAAMAAGDNFLLDVAKHAVLGSLTDGDDIRYRQDVLRDCIRNPSVVKEIYAITVQAIETERQIYRSVFFRSPNAILRRGVDAMQALLGMLARLRRVADEQLERFCSEGFIELFGTLGKEVDDTFFVAAEDHLTRLGFRDGVLISARLDVGNKGAGYILRRPLDTRRGLVARLSDLVSDPFTLRISDRDESGARTLADLRERGIDLVADALEQSVDHVLGFFNVLRSEVGFYVGCLNLHARMAERSVPTCFPVPAARGETKLSAKCLYDTCLALRMDDRVTSNDIAADRKLLVVITGANQGGKSTTLRSLGLAQLMMQCGMFVSAEALTANVCDRLFTHFKREEDATMESGKLDEELSRMSDIAAQLTPNSILLCNESFAATNEREGSEIARQVLRALIEAGVKVYFVTHLFDLADGLYRERLSEALFLRAGRQADGRRTFRMVEGEPLPTSFGEDLYKQVFTHSFLPDR